jgi:hypothetical protein
MAARGWLVVDVVEGSMSMLSKDLMKPEVVKDEEGSRSARVEESDLYL